VRRLAEATGRFPEDARIHFVYARALRHTGDDAQANSEMARSLALDSRQPFALELHADFLAYDGETKRALDAINDCLDLAPAAVGCLLERAWILGELGRCSEVEATSRRMLTVSADDGDAVRTLANALYAQGRPLATSRDLLRRVADKGADTSSRLDAIHLAILSGDFATATSLAVALHDEAAKSSVATDHAIPDALLVDVYRETHREAEAAAIAAEYLDGRDAWEPEARLEDWAMANEPTPKMLRVRLDAKAIPRATYDAELAKTLARWDARVERSARNFIWVYGYAAPAETPADGIAAKAAVGKYAPLPPYKPLSLADEAIGRAYLLAGDVDGAIPYLEHATATCFPVDHPIEHTRAEELLGEAREAKGDVKGACAAYGVVSERWRGATPKSVTADKAIARMTALGCSK